MAVWMDRWMDVRMYGPVMINIISRESSETVGNPKP